MSDVWLPAPEWEGIYEVSTRGFIRSIDRLVTHRNGAIHQLRGRVLSPKVNNKGYLMVAMHDAESGRKAFKTIHRIVATAFIPNPFCLPEVNHIDGLKANCASINLEWSSSSNNSKHSTRLRLNPVAKLSDAQVVEIRNKLALGILPKDLASEFGVDRSSIQSIRTGKTYAWVTGGKRVAVLNVKRSGESDGADIR